MRLINIRVYYRDDTWYTFNYYDKQRFGDDRNL